MMKDKEKEGKKLHGFNIDKPVYLVEKKRACVMCPICCGDGAVEFTMINEDGSRGRIEKCLCCGGTGLVSQYVVVPASVVSVKGRFFETERGARLDEVDGVVIQIEGHFRTTRVSPKRLFNDLGDAEKYAEKKNRKLHKEFRECRKGTKRLSKNTIRDIRARDDDTYFNDTKGQPNYWTLKEKGLIK